MRHSRTHAGISGRGLQSLPKATSELWDPERLPKSWVCMCSLAPSSSHHLLHFYVKAKKQKRRLGWKKARALYKPLTWDAEVSWRAHLSPAWIQPEEPLEIPVTAGTQHTWDPKSSSVPQHHLGTPCFKGIPWFCYHPSLLKEMTTCFIFSAEWLKTGSRKKPVCAEAQIRDTGE